MVTSRSFALALTLLIPVGCSAPESGENAVHDDSPPVLSIDSPERGTTLDGNTVVVRGHASDPDSGIDEVRIGDARAEIASDGAFEISINVGSGISTLEIVATNKAGLAAHEMRSVLAGPFAEIGSPVGDAVVAYLDRDGLSAVGSAVGDLIAAQDFSALIGDGNLVDTGGSCLGAQVRLDALTFGDVYVGLTPGRGSLTAEVSLSDLDATIKINYKLACIGGSATVTLSANAVQLNGTMELAAIDGNIEANFNDLSVGFNGFGFNVGGVPGAIEDLIKGKVETKLADALQNQLDTMLPDLVANALTTLSSSQLQFDVLGSSLEVTPRVGHLEFTDAGGALFIDVGIATEDTVGVRYSATDSAAPDLATAGSSISVALAENVINQALAIFWASGALDLEAPPVELLSALFGPNAGSLQVQFLLPPTLQTRSDGTVELNLGDVLLNIADTTGSAPLAEFALAGTFTLGAKVTEDGSIRIATDVDSISVQVIRQSDSLATKLEGTLIEGLAGPALNVVSSSLNSALGSVPLPTLGGADLATATVSGDGAYMVIGIDAAAP